LRNAADAAELPRRIVGEQRSEQYFESIHLLTVAKANLG
jgi:hypothetical protein